jgi:hypothetical protein
MLLVLIVYHMEALKEPVVDTDAASRILRGGGGRDGRFGIGGSGRGDIDAGSSIIGDRDEYFGRGGSLDGLYYVSSLSFKTL